jgi:hypothetical protein
MEQCMSVRRKDAMLAFMKSELFLRFLGGFAIGAVAMVSLHSEDQPSLTTSAYAQPAEAPAVVDRAEG